MEVAPQHYVGIEFIDKDNNKQEIITDFANIDKLGTKGTEVTIAYLKNYKYEIVLLDDLGSSYVNWAKKYVYR